jgi:hypothetical protein
VSVIICHHCAEAINTVNVPYYTMAHCVGSAINTGHIKAIAFHQECFKEVAGEEYSDSLQPDEVVLTGQDVNEVFEYNHNLSSGSFIPPRSQQHPAVGQMKNNGIQCNFCYSRRDPGEMSQMGNSPICKRCFQNLFQPQK